MYQVQKESIRLLGFYIFNLALCVLIFLQIIQFCFIPSNYIGVNFRIKKCDFTNQIHWSLPYQLSFILGMISILILMLSFLYFLNAYLCQRDFGKNLKFIVSISFLNIILFSL